MSDDIKKNKNNILYRPDLDYDKNYDTEYTTEIETIDIPEEKESELDQIKKHIINIKALLPIVPIGLRDMANNQIKVIESILPEVNPVEKKPESITERIEIVIPDPGPEPEPENPEDDLPYPDPYIEPDPDPFIIHTETKDKITLIEEDYNYNIVSIILDYIDNLNKIINDYLNQMIVSLRPIPNNLYDKAINSYGGHTNNVSTDLKHLSDLVIRSERNRDMKMRLYNKRYSLDNTINKIRACKIGVEQRLRYYTANYSNDMSYSGMISNRQLENSRMIYDQKYKQNFIDLYKYLNSSVILYNECLKMSLNEIQAKSILLMKEGSDLW